MKQLTQAERLERELTKPREYARLSIMRRYNPRTKTYYYMLRTKAFKGHLYGDWCENPIAAIHSFAHIAETSGLPVGP